MVAIAMGMSSVAMGLFSVAMATVVLAIGVVAMEVANVSVPESNVLGISIASRAAAVAFRANLLMHLPLCPLILGQSSLRRHCVPRPHCVTGMMNRNVGVIFNLFSR